MNITPEQIPDEVVEAAFDAMRLAEARQFGDVKTPNNGARHECMRAALAAALPVLLGRAFQAGWDACWDKWSNARAGMYVDPDPRREGIPPYTLPTPETPNAHP